MKSNYKRTPWTFKYNGKLITTSESEWMEYHLGLSFILRYNAEDFEAARKILMYMERYADIDAIVNMMGYDIFLERSPDRDVTIGTLRKRRNRDQFTPAMIWPTQSASNIFVEYTSPPRPSVFQRFTRWVSSWTT